MYVSLIYLSGMGNVIAEPAYSGLWDIEIRVQHRGMPVPVAPMKTRQCLNQSNPVPDTSAPGDNCTLSEIKHDNKRMIWSVKCDHPSGPVTGKGQVVFTKTRMNGWVDYHMPKIGNQLYPTSIKHSLRGHYVGVCK